MAPPKRSKTSKTLRHTYHRHQSDESGVDPSTLDIVSSEIFQTYEPASSVDLPCINMKGLETVIEGDIIVTLPQPSGGYPSASACVATDTPTVDVPSMQVHSSQTTASITGGPFDSDDEGAEFTYQNAVTGKVEGRCTPQDLWHALISEMRKHNGETYVKLHWLYRARDFDGLRLDRYVKALVTTLSPAELVFSDHTTINKADCIFAKSPLVPVHTKYCLLRPLSHNDTFACTDNKIVIENGKVRIKNTTQICYDEGCKQNRNYSAGHDAVRFCANPHCLQWYHTACIRKFQGSVDENTEPSCIYEAITSTNEYKQAYSLLIKLVLSPIQRAPPAVWSGNMEDLGEYPVSFEQAILSARQAWAQGQSLGPDKTLQVRHQPSDSLRQRPIKSPAHALQSPVGLLVHAYSVL
ncbi:hypothetical protein C8Q78DRAFT_1082454 [Trametes maxima]|nr:hypothetical protein C8Q78DRAFT_1083636 [Trametes maxima]KAI0667337.1 hypothetical protein C8Q78DRAFT_1082454 [Trametes maxima]